MKYTFEELLSLSKEANRNPWEFFLTHSIKEVRILSHPDKWPLNPSAPSLFISFNEAYERSLLPQVYIGKYPLLSKMAEGDLRDIFVSIGGVIVKVPKIADKDANRLIQKEADTLTLLKNESKGNIIQYFFPHMVDSIEQDGKLHNITIYDRKLHTAAKIKEVFPEGLDGRHIGWMLRRMIVGVGYMHSLGLCHGAITPEHVMFCAENHAGVLTGIIHSDEIGKKISVVPAKRKDWYPDYAKNGLTRAVDFDMISKTITFLSGGSLPNRLKNFIKALSYLSGSCVSAAELEGDLKDILECCYGKPKFVDLVGLD
jgi:serine/threonine protein kinase